MMQPDQNPQPLLSVRDLKVRFGSKQVVHGVSFDVRAGEKLALVGESGSGKTVTALSLLQLVGEAQLSGQALFDGRDLLALTEREMRGVRGGDIAMIFQARPECRYRSGWSPPVAQTVPWCLPSGH